MSWSIPAAGLFENFSRGHFFCIRERVWVAFALYGETTETFGFKAQCFARLSYLTSKSISSTAPSQFSVAHIWTKGEGWFPFEFERPYCWAIWVSTIFGTILVFGQMIKIIYRLVQNTFTGFCLGLSGRCDFLLSFMVNLMLPCILRNHVLYACILSNKITRQKALLVLVTRKNNNNKTTDCRRQDNCKNLNQNKLCVYLVLHQ